MTVAANTKPRAFAVWWNALGKWDVASTWLHSGLKISHQLQSLAKVMKVRWQVVSKEEASSNNVTMVDRVSFDGEVFAGQKQLTKMEQYLALPGDIVVSKIRARQGSVGLISQQNGPVSVTIHYRVLIPDERFVDASYAWLALRSNYCRSQFLAATGGAMKGEISEEALFAINLPLPALAQQQSIVARWRKALDEIAATNARIVKLEAEVPLILYHLLGTPPPLIDKPVEKFLALWWKDLERWSFNFLSRSAQGLTGFSLSKYPITSLGTHLIETMNGYCIKPVAGPTPHKMLKLNALLPSGLDLSASKFIKIPDRTAQRFSIHKGDLFICRSVGSYSHVAKCALAKIDAPGTLFPDIMIRVRLKDSLLPEYVCEVIQSPLGRSFFQSNARTSVGMWKIGAEDIASFPIPIPPLSVQRHIIERMATQREKIAREKANAERLSREINAEIEAQILGKKRVGA